MLYIHIDGFEHLLILKQCTWHDGQVFAPQPSTVSHPSTTTSLKAMPQCLDSLVGLPPGGSWEWAKQSSASLQKTPRCGSLWKFGTPKPTGEFSFSLSIIKRLFRSIWEVYPFSYTPISKDNPLVGIQGLESQVQRNPVTHSRETQISQHHEEQGGLQNVWHSQHCQHGYDSTPGRSGWRQNMWLLGIRGSHCIYPLALTSLTRCRSY